MLGAGLGTRLKKLTEHLPKPLIPVQQKPLLTYAFDHLLDAGFSSFVVNTHHRPEAYDAAFPDRVYRDAPLAFREETVLLETAGGIANVRDLLGEDEPFAVYNGDILTDLPLKPLLEAHAASGNLVTLVLRSEGTALQVAFDRGGGQVTDLRNYLETNSPDLFQFTGIYMVNPEFFHYLTPGEKKSVIPVFLDIIRERQGIGGVVIDEGRWWDLGTRGTYLHASATLSRQAFPAHGKQPEQVRIHPTAQIGAHAHICPQSSLSEGCVVGEGAHVDNSILWPGAVVAPHASLRNTIVRTGQRAEGILVDEDV